MTTKKLLQAELRALETQSGDQLTEVTPVSGSFCHTLRAEIGISGEVGADAFELDVCSPEWLESELETYPALSGGSRVFMRRFDPEEVETYVRKRLRHAVGDDWQAIAQQIGQWARWEFADYTP